MNDLISIIVPVYNVEKYLPECIESILCQTYKNVEIILVDDGSPDNSPQICDEYCKKDDRIRVIHKKNGGLSDARNEGMKNARGEWFCFVDSDDKVMPTYIEDLLNAAKKYNSKLSLCNHVFIDEEGNALPSNTETFVKDEMMLQADFYKRAMLERQNLFVVAWNKLYHKSLWEHISYPVGVLREDEHVFCDIVNQCDVIAGTISYDYCYRTRNGSIMQTENVRNHLDMLAAYKKQTDYYIGKGMDEVAIINIGNMLNELMMSRMCCRSKKERSEYKYWVDVLDCYYQNNKFANKWDKLDRFKYWGIHAFPWILNLMGKMAALIEMK